jgi:hypothetical protein
MEGAEMLLWEALLCLSHVWFEEYCKHSSAEFRDFGMDFMQLEISVTEY